MVLSPLPKARAHARHASMLMRLAIVAGAVFLACAIAVVGLEVIPAITSHSAVGGGPSGGSKPWLGTPLAHDGAATTGARVCGNSSVLNGPSKPPKHAVRVAAGYDNPYRLDRPNTTYWFAPGVHTFGTGLYDQIIPGNRGTYIGAPGAVISGQGKNGFAFTQSAVGVRIEYLTIEHFIPPGGQGAVNSDSASGWTLSNDTIAYNVPGAAIMLGPKDTVKNSCLTRNGQYGFNAYLIDRHTDTGGPNDVSLIDNEISYNDTCNWEKTPNLPVARPAGCGNVGFASCGCSGGGKFWEVDGATVTGNYVYDNYNVGLWVDTNNTGFDISNNDISSNWNEGVLYEISYNAQIDDNTFVDNGWGEGPTNPGFATGAIYVSESGGDRRVPGPYSGQFQIAGNLFSNNWAGVVLWENANRFCGSPGEDAPTTCTLVDKKVANPKTCTQANLQGATPRGHPDYYDLCRWKTQNVSVLRNVFSFTASDVPGCTGSRTSCGENSLFSEWGTYPSWTPYFRADVEQAITYEQHNVFSYNEYFGPWRFMAKSQAGVVPFAVWQTVYRQDLHSTA